jgi:hypothetical protein
MGDKELSMAIPLDSDRFMRRECPTCERELKWRPTPEGEEGIPASDAGYFCPYCAVQAPTTAWWTQDQVKTVEAKVHNAVIKPMLDDFGQSLQRSSSANFKVTSKPMEREDEPQLSETDDMRRVDFECHPTEPVKVLESWDQAVHCIVCGQPAT